MLNTLYTKFDDLMDTKLNPDIYKVCYKFFVIRQSLFLCSSYPLNWRSKKYKIFLQLFYDYVNGDVAKSQYVVIGQLNYLSLFFILITTFSIGRQYSYNSYNSRNERTYAISMYRAVIIRLVGAKLKINPLSGKFFLAIPNKYSNTLAFETSYPRP